MSYQFPPLMPTMRGRHRAQMSREPDAKLPGINYPHRRPQSEIEGLLTRHLAIAFFVDQVIRPSARGSYLQHVQFAGNAVFLNGVGAALQNGDLRLERRIELESGRRRW